jgi:hypothetical protein
MFSLRVRDPSRANNIRETHQVKKEWQPKEPNPYEYIEFMPETKQFRVTIPRAAYRPVVDSLAEAMTVRDRMLQSRHFPQAQPRREYANYMSFVDPNVPEESRTTQ